MQNFIYFGCELYFTNKICIQIIIISKVLYIFFNLLCNIIVYQYVYSINTIIPVYKK